MLLKIFAKSSLLRSCGSKLSPRFSEYAKCTTLKSFSTSVTRSSDTEQLESLYRSGVQFGQPTHFTHPHMLKNNELAIGILPSEFADRRQKLMEQIKQHCVEKSKPNRSIVIIPAAQKKYMTGKIPYFFRQNTDFYYLTGCLEPDSVLILWTDDENRTKSTLFMRPKDKHDELWDGPRTGAEHATTFFGVDEAFSLVNLREFLTKYINQSNSTNIWYDVVDQTQTNVYAMIRSIAPASQIFQSPIEFLHELRVIKSPAEADLMRKTCEIASNAVNWAMQESKPGDSEHYIHARVDFHCRMNDAQFLAYPPVVAAGNNANVIHYINNTQTAKDGELVLMDAGCEYGGYSSDITRTWPINGHFTPAQKVLYDVVHSVQTELLNAVASIENVTLDQLFDLMCYRLGKYLQEIGVIGKSLSELDSARHAAFKFCPHHVSHYLGMDIHDTPLIQRDRLLKPGMVFTVEPGLYIPADSEVPKEFRGIGIRIEDDVLYTDDGIEVLTSKCIKDVSELKDLLSK